LHDIAAGKDAWATQWRWGALVLGLLMLSRLVPKWGWISRWPMGLVVGAFAALNLVGYAQASLMDQLNATLMPLAGRAPGKDVVMALLPPATNAGAPCTLNHLVLIVGVISVLTYFFFSTSQIVRIRQIGQLGIAFVMITFGASYGSIVMARVSLLIGRVQMLTDANTREMGYPFTVCAILIIAILAFWRAVFYRPPEESSPVGEG
jgi:hypothetical protein